MQVKIGIILDTRRIKKTSKYPVKLRVTFERVTVYYQTIFDLSKDDYAKLSAPRISIELQSIRDKLKDIERTAENALKEPGAFSFKDFEKDYVQNHSSYFRLRKLPPELPLENKSDFDYTPFHKKFPILLEHDLKPGTFTVSYRAFIKKTLREGRISSGMYYHCSYVSLKKFRGNVRLEEITVSFLHEYESWLRQQNISSTTIGMYLRPLRTIFNEAIEDGIIKREKHYPFGRRKYKIPASKNTKKALDLNDIKRIYYYQCDPKNESEQRARDYWLFSYFGNGMNPKDIACLKYKNIQGEYLIFERSKTERAMRSDPKPITVFINDDMKTIIKRWGNKEASPNNYVFPIMEQGTSPLRQYELMQLFVHFINNWMKHILNNLGIDKKVTTYVARHTFSTVLKRSGASTEYIQEALGHSNIKTTENYLDSFEKEVKKDFAKRLTAFKEPALQSDLM